MATLLTVIGAVALSLTAAPAHAHQTQMVNPYVASRGQEVRVALPSRVRTPGDLSARIKVAGTTTVVRATRARGRQVRVPVDIPELTGPAAQTPSGEVKARLTLESDHRRLLATSFELRTGGTPQPAGPSPSPSPSPTVPTAEPPVSVPTQESPAPPVAPAESHDLLNWAPPPLTAPSVVTVPDGQDPAILRLSTTRDYVVELPPGGIHGTLEINGGHNVVLIGGEVTVPSTANQLDNGADNTDTAIYVRAATGTVHIEGVLIKADTDTEFDGIDVNAPLATVQVENVRMEDVYGTRIGEHADVIQTWGGVKELDVDDLTANGDYQGLTLAPALGAVGTVHLENVDLTAEAAPLSLAANLVGGGIMLWLTRGATTCESASVTLQDVYIANLTGRILSANTVWPSPSSPLTCGANVSGGTITWSGLPVSGGVTMGSPPKGPFVPQGVAGNAYSSPGYQPS